MKFNAFVALLILGASPWAVTAQQASGNLSTPLNDTQVLGRRVFHQRCAVCHTQSTPGARRYGPTLYKDLVDDNEDAIREFIRNGSTGKMPGFKYGLEPSEIDAIVDYLKTVAKPSRQSGPVQEGPVD